MEKAPEYEIEHIDDFLKVPADRLDDCVGEFKTFLKLHLASRQVVKSIAEMLAEMDATTKSKFVWIDDGTHNVSVIFKGQLSGEQAQRRRTAILPSSRRAHGVR